MPRPDHEPRTWCPQCGAVCTTCESEGWIVFGHIKEPTIGTYTEAELVQVFAERARFRAALEWIAGAENHAAGLEINSRLRAKNALDASV